MDKPNKPKIIINNFLGYKGQKCNLGTSEWSVPRLIQLSKDLPVMDIPMVHLNFYASYNDMTLRAMVGHFKSMMDADLSYPIILDEDGDILDGRHRIMKALFLGNETIKAVRFEQNPEPDTRNE